MITYPIGLLTSRGSRILVGMSPTASYTVGFNLTFTGNVYIDFKDGDGKEALTSGVEKTHLYAIADTYIAEISGDIETITAFTADNSKITFISGLSTGLLTDFDISDNEYVGNLNIIDAPVTGSLLVYSNPGLSGIDFSLFGNGTLTNLRFQSCDFTGRIDLGNVNISGTIFAFSNPNFTGFDFSTSGNGVVSSLNAGNCNITGILVLTNVRITNGLTILNNPLLTGVSFATSGNGQTEISAQNCNLTGPLILTNLPVKGSMRIETNPLLTGISFATSGNATLSGFRFQGCDITGVFDWSNLPVAGFIIGTGNANMTNVLFSATSNGVLTHFLMDGCNLTNLDFSTFPTSTPTITLTNNSFTATEHDNQLINLAATGWLNGTLNITTGNTARTSASDIAYNTLIANGWAIT